MMNTPRHAETTRAIAQMDSLLSFLVSLEKQRIRRIRTEIKDLPKGTLYLNSSRGKPYFLHVIGSTRRSISQDQELLYTLARKRYLLLLLKDHEQLLSQIRWLTRKDDRCGKPRGNIGSLTRQLLRKYGEAGLDVLRITCSKEQYLWAKRSYYSNPVNPSERVFETYSGVKVRSKSERRIGNELELHGIPYRYEPGVQFDVSWMEGVNGAAQGKYKNYFPDFLILTATGEYIVWEHLGRADLAGYRTHNMEKISAYRHSGYVDDAHLILTYEKDFEQYETITEIVERRVMIYM